MSEDYERQAQREIRELRALAEGLLLVCAERAARLAALEQVAEAARDLRRASVPAEGQLAPYFNADRRLRDALAALDQEAT